MSEPTKLEMNHNHYSDCPGCTATITRLTAEIATFDEMVHDCEAERDSLAASLEEAEVQVSYQRAAARAFQAELSELRARVDEAVAYIDSKQFDDRGPREDELLAILVPPEGP